MIAMQSCAPYMGQYGIVQEVYLRERHTPQSKYLTYYKCWRDIDEEGIGGKCYVTDTVNKFWPGDTIWFGVKKCGK